jgi:hypothetical protein
MAGAYEGFVSCSRAFWFDPTGGSGRREGVMMAENCRQQLGHTRNESL